MHIDLKLPVLVRAQPAATRKTDRYFFGSHMHGAEIAEVSTGETDIAFGPMVTDTHSSGRTMFPALRSYGGRLYRPIGNAPVLLQTAFAGGGSWNTDDFMLSSPPLADMRGGPLSYPVASRLTWFVTLHGMNTDRNAKLWPEKPDLMETTLIESTDLRDINRDDLFYCRRMHEAQADRLLSIEGKMWMATTMPCITVALRNNMGRSSVTASLGYLPLVPKGYGTEVRFPLGMAGEAAQYAQSLAQDDARAGPPEFPMLDLDPDTSVVDFDQSSEELHEFAWGIASNVVRAVEQRAFHKHHEGSQPLFTGADKTRYDTIREELLASNDILDERRDLVELIPDIVDLWNIAKKSRYPGLWTPPTEHVAGMVTRKMAMFEDRDISLPLASSGPKFI